MCAIDFLAVKAYALFDGEGMRYDSTAEDQEVLSHRISAALELRGKTGDMESQEWD